MKNKKVLIFGSIFLFIVLIICCAIGFGMYLFVTAQQEAEMKTKVATEEFEAYITSYKKEAKQIESTWSRLDSECYTQDELDKIMKGSYYESEINQMRNKALDLIDKERVCNEEIRDEIIEMTKATFAKAQSLDCDAIEDSETCSDIVSYLGDLVELQEEMLVQMGIDYDVWRELHVCYLKAFKDNFGSDSKIKSESEKCLKGYPSDYIETNKLNTEYESKVLIIEDLIEKYN